MSKREDIVADIVHTLETTTKDDQTKFQIRKVTRDPVIIEDLAVTALPCVFVQSANEFREYGSMGGEIDVEMEVLLHCYVGSTSRDQDRNTLLEIIENALYADTTRGSTAIDTRVTAINLIEAGESSPYASLEVTVVVDYCYMRGNP